MKTIKNAGIDFAVDSNVHIEVLSPQNVITQTIDKHNKATINLVSGILRFLRGEFNTTNRRTNENSITYKNDAKNYIPCYIGAGTAGIIINEETGMPAYNDNRREPPITTDWETATVNYLSTKLDLEIDSVSRYEIGILDAEEDDNYTVSSGDISQIVLKTDIEPGYYNKMYGNTTDIFITELGLFPTNIPNNPDMLARVVFTDSDSILYVRPQDTIIVRWVISIISLDDYSRDDEGQQIEDTINNSINIEYVHSDEPGL